MRTFAQSASSSSARISGSEVSDPCPISAAGDMIATVSSVAIVTHGLIVTSPLRAAAEIGIPDRDRHGSGLPGGALDGAHNARIGPAATDIGAHVLDDLGARRF